MGADSLADRCSRRMTCEERVQPSVMTSHSPPAEGGWMSIMLSTVRGTQETIMRRDGLEQHAV